MPPSDLFLIRHAESTWNAIGRWQGQADPPLSPRGERQARVLARHFPDVTVAHLRASDLSRARATADALGARLELPTIVDPDLREIDVGSWSGRTRAQIAADDPSALERYFQGVAGWHGGETYEAHELRCGRVAEQLASLDIDGAAVAVSHGGTIRGILRTLLEIPHAERWRMSGPAHTSLTHLRNDPQGWRLITYSAVLDLRRA